MAEGYRPPSVSQTLPLDTIVFYVMLFVAWVYFVGTAFENARHAHRIHYFHFQAYIGIFHGAIFGVFWYIDALRVLHILWALVLVFGMIVGVGALLGSAMMYNAVDLLRVTSESAIGRLSLIFNMFSVCFGILGTVFCSVEGHCLTKPDAAILHTFYFVAGWGILFGVYLYGVIAAGYERVHRNHMIRHGKLDCRGMKRVVMILESLGAWVSLFIAAYIIFEAHHMGHIHSAVVRSITI